MPTLDVHQHLWPEPFVAELRRRTEPPRLDGDVLELASEGRFDARLDQHDVETRIELLDRDGIDVAVVSLAPTLGVELLRPDEAQPLLDAYHAGMRELASGGRFAAFSAGACLPGFVGASLAAGALVAGGDGVARLLEDLDRRGEVLFVHPGPGTPRAGLPGWWASLTGYTSEMQAAFMAWLARDAERYPNVRVVFAILAGGAPVQLERLRSRGVEETLPANVYFETASYGRHALELCLSTFGVERLLYGSDLPVIDSAPTLHALAAFGDAVLDAARCENPSRLLA